MNSPIEISGKIATVCAWCVPSEKQSELRLQGFTLSHGICKSCSERELAKLKKPISASKLATLRAQSEVVEREFMTIN